MTHRPDDRAIRPHDRLFRLTFGEDRSAVVGELRAVLPPAIVAAIDWSTLEPADPALLGPDLRERTTDLLFTVRLAGREALLYVLFEHQSSDDPLFVVRAYVYVARVWERWLRRRPGAERVPPVIPVLLAHGAGRRSGLCLADVVDLGAGAYRAALEPLVPTLDIPLVDDLDRLDDERLEQRELPATAKLALAALRDVRSSTDLAATLRTLDRRWVRTLPRDDPRSAEAVEALLSYIPAARPHEDLATIGQAVRAVWPDGKEVLMATIQELIDQSASEAWAKGKAEGEAEGAAAGEREILVRLLVRRFGALGPTVQARIASAGRETLERWAEQIFEVGSPEELVTDG